MKTVCWVAALAVSLSAGAVAAAPRMTAEQRLAKEIASRTAGTPVSCVRQRDVRSTTMVRDVGVVYSMNNGTLFVNRPAGGGSFTPGFNDYMVTVTFSSQLCRGDIVRLVDRGSNMDSGSFGLGDFVPYPKPSRAG